MKDAEEIAKRRLAAWSVPMTCDCNECAINHALLIAIEALERVASEMHPMQPRIAREALAKIRERK